MLRAIVAPILVLLAILLPSCLDIEEEIFFNKDGSGTYVSRVDLSGLSDMILMMMPDSVLEQMEGDPQSIIDSVLSSQEMLSSLTGMADEINLQDGISGTATDIREGVLTIRMDFASVEQLTNALNRSAEASQFEILTPAFEWGKRRLIRTVPENLHEMDEEMAGQAEMLNSMMGDATYLLRYHFPGKVKSSSHPDARITQGGNTVEVELSLRDMLEDPALANQEIRFRRR